MRLSTSMRQAIVWGLAGGIGAAAITALATLVGLSSMSAVVPTALVVAAVLAATKYVRDILTADLLRAQRRLRARIWRVEAQLPDLAAIATFSAVNVAYPLPLGTRWALSWDAATVLAREIGALRPDSVVELGSGASTLVIGLQLRSAGRGHLYSLEHEPSYGAETQRHVTALGLESWVSVLEAPLVPHTIGGEQFTWYQVPPEVASLDRIDAVVVDGPPQTVDPDGMPRYPALAILGPQLGPGSLVFVDDARRDAEKRMLERWRTEQPQWVQRYTSTKKGTAVLRWPDGP